MKIKPSNIPLALSSHTAHIACAAESPDFATTLSDPCLLSQWPAPLFAPAATGDTDVRALGLRLRELLANYRNFIVLVADEKCMSAAEIEYAKPRGCACHPIGEFKEAGSASPPPCQSG